MYLLELQQNMHIYHIKKINKEKQKIASYCILALLLAQICKWLCWLLNALSQKTNEIFTLKYSFIGFDKP